MRETTNGMSLDSSLQSPDLIIVGIEQGNTSHVGSTSWDHWTVLASYSRTKGDICRHSEYMRLHKHCDARHAVRSSMPPPGSGPNTVLFSGRTPLALTLHVIVSI